MCGRDVRVLYLICFVYTVQSGRSFHAFFHEKITALRVYSKRTMGLRLSSHMRTDCLKRECEITSKKLRVQLL